jgi:hypothetical protein
MVDKDKLNTGSVPEVFRDQVHDDNYVLNELKTLQRKNNDAFGNSILNRTNVLDLAAHYPYSPERWRIFVDGSRVFPEYTSVSQYTHDTDRHLLQPAAGETVVFESAEKPRYVVQYELACTLTFALNQSLQSGDSLVVGLYDGSDGWYMEQDGTHNDDEADFVTERSGTEVYRQENLDIYRATTQFARLRLQSAWYDIARQKWSRSFPELNNNTDAFAEQENPVNYEIQASDSTTGLELEAGSAAQVNLGTTTALTRNKIATETFNIGTSGTWLPQFCLRIDPDNPNVNIQLSDVAIIEQETQSDVRVSAQACDPSNVLDSGGNELTSSDYSTPEILSDTNQALQISTAVEQFPNSSGTTVTSTDTPGGWQVGYDSLYTAQGNNTADQAAGNIASKRPIYSQDVIVFIANAGGTGGVSINYRSEQDW